MAPYWRCYHRRKNAENVPVPHGFYFQPICIKAWARVVGQQLNPAVWRRRPSLIHTARTSRCARLPPAHPPPRPIASAWSMAPWRRGKTAKLHDLSGGRECGAIQFYTILTVCPLRWLCGQGDNREMSVPAEGIARLKVKAPSRPGPYACRISSARLRKPIAAGHRRALAFRCRTPDPYRSCIR